MSIDPTAKLKIVSLEDPLLTVVAQFNPKEVSVDRSVPWQKQKKGPAHLEFTAGEPKTMSFELMFDSFDTSVEIEIDNLHKLADVVPALRRPPRVKVIWGAPGDSAAPDDESAGGGISSFQAVIESVEVKHTTVTPDGKVVRATANVKFKEAADFKVGNKH
jgi:Contractile injection system tube protein